MEKTDRILILCGGPKSSGTSIISWCFLQRPDMDGMFDGNGDIICTVPDGINTPYIWYKLTITGFRLCEQISCAETEGYQVRPLLVIRDVRLSWASLAGKSYGRNGNTAEDPPLRIMMRRFLEDWQTFHRNGWPILKYEQFVKSPEQTLRKTCDELKLSWDPAIITWPTPQKQIANIHHGSATFLSSIKGGLMSSLQPDAVDRVRHPIPVKDLEWLESEFSDFNQINGYPAHRDIPHDSVDRLVPRFDVTRRFMWRLHQKPLRLILYKMGFKKAANLPRTISSNR